MKNIIHQKHNIISYESYILSKKHHVSITKTVNVMQLITKKSPVQSAKDNTYIYIYNSFDTF